MTTETARRHYPIYGKGVTSATYDRYGEAVVPRRADEYVEVEKNSVPAGGLQDGGDPLRADRRSRDGALRVAEQARTSRETAEIAWRQAHEHDAD